MTESFKALAAQSLELICIHIDGALTFIYTFIKEILDYTLKDNTEIILSELIAPHCQNSIFVNSISIEVKVETCLLILSILSHLIKKRSELM